MHSIISKQIINSATLLLLSTLILLSIGNLFSPDIHTPFNKQQSIQRSTPCQQKAAKQTAQLCELKHLNSYTLVQDIFSFPSNLSTSVYFIFILGLFTSCHQRRIEKPPK